MKAVSSARKKSAILTRLMFVLAVITGWTAVAAAELPAVLSANDAQTYRQIFTLQAQAQMGGMARLTDSLSDKRLMGHVLAQRYLHPTAYRSSYQELARWLEQYADYPGAEKIYVLALRKRPADAAAPRRPISVQNRFSATFEGAKEYRSRAARSKAAIQQISAIKLHLRSLLKKGDGDEALRYLQREDIARRLDPVETGIARHGIAASFYYKGRDQDALRLAVEVAAQNGRIVPQAHWLAGLASWRLGRTEEAAKHFTAMTEENSPYASREALSAAAYWAARANLAIRQPQQVNAYLQKAARNPHTMYGLLAIRQLGHQMPFDWELPVLSANDISDLQRQPEVLRMLALLEAGQSSLAEKEMQRLHGRLGPRNDAKLLALAAELHLPASQIRIAETAKAKGKVWLAGLYPLPDWQPQGGFTTDPALLFALARQESNFAAGAEGPGGARGLMQLMPATASFIGRDKGLRGTGHSRLFDPVYNLTLGQKYIQHLQRSGTYTDLFSIIASYNAGPGAVEAWREKSGRVIDPLLFLESVPSADARGYIMRAVASYWIYQDRMGAPLTALDAIAQGKWPQLTPVSGKRAGAM